MLASQHHPKLIFCINWQNHFHPTLPPPEFGSCEENVCLNVRQQVLLEMDSPSLWKDYICPHLSINIFKNAYFTQQLVHFFFFVSGWIVLALSSFQEFLAFSVQNRSATRGYRVARAKFWVWVITCCLKEMTYSKFFSL